jgi:hypothetical protein
VFGSKIGIALAQEIRNRYPRLPVLLTSGYSDATGDRKGRISVSTPI